MSNPIIDFPMVSAVPPTLQIINHREHHLDNIVAVKAAAPYMEAAIMTAFYHSPAGMATLLVKTYIDEGLQKLVASQTVESLVERDLFMAVCAMERLNTYVAKSFISYTDNLRDEILKNMDITGLVNILAAIDKYTAFSRMRNPAPMEHSPQMDLVKRMFEFDAWKADLDLVVTSCLIDKLRDMLPKSEG